MPPEEDELAVAKQLVNKMEIQNKMLLSLLAVDSSLVSIIGVTAAGAMEPQQGKVNADFIEAVLHGNMEPARKALDAGAQMSARTPNGGTPLYAACQGGYLELAKLLVARGAAVNERSANS